MKIDGSQFSFRLEEDGTLSCRSKGADLIVDAPEKMFAQGVETVKRLASADAEAPPGWVGRGVAGLLGERAVSLKTADVWAAKMPATWPAQLTLAQVLGIARGVMRCETCQRAVRGDDGQPCPEQAYVQGCVHWVGEVE